jgi:AbrB family looped-hinge helix DNA binding protein
VAQDPARSGLPVSRIVLIIAHMLSVKISTKHQIAVPSEARRKLGLKAGDRLDVEVDGDVIHLRRHVPAGDRLYGIGAHIWDGTDPAARIRALRDEWEARQLEREAQVARDIAAAWAEHGRPEVEEQP